MNKIKARRRIKTIHAEQAATADEMDSERCSCCKQHNELKLLPDVKAPATRAAIDETVTAGSNGARAEAAAETQAGAARAAVDVKATVGNDESAEAKPGAQARAIKAEAQDKGHDTDKRRKEYKIDDRHRGSS